MDLPVCRMRQIVKSIEQRTKLQKARDDMVVEWQTKTLANFIANTVKVPKGKQNPLVKAVESIRLVDMKELEDGTIPYTPEQIDPADDPAVYVEQGSQVAEQRNSPGSFERLLNGFREAPQG